MTQCRATTTMIRSARSVRWRRLRRCSRAAARACASPSPAATFALARAAPGLGVTNEIELPEAKRARAAANIISASEGVALHLGRLRARGRDFDPAVRDRLIAGAMIPAAHVVKAQKFRR